MAGEHNRKTVLVGSRAIMLFAAGLVALAAILTLIALGIKRAGAPAESPPVAGPGSDAIATPRRPGETPQPTAVLAPTIAPTSGEVIHTVQPGETLVGIAAQYGVNLNTILEANDLTLDSVLFAGQTLVIPLKPDEFGVWHEVKYGETLTSIATRYGVSAEEIQRRNGLPDANAIVIGQRLYIPLPPGATTPTPDQTQGGGPLDPATDPLLQSGPVQAEWPRSLYRDEEAESLTLADNYPLTFNHERFTVHYQPGTYTEAHLADLVTLIADSLESVEDRLDVGLAGRFDVYLAGTLFRYPYAFLRGQSLSAERQVFFLFDGSGDEADRRYMAVHELTHLVAWNTWGAPSSILLSEGLATWSGQSVPGEGDSLPYQQVCLAAQSAGVLPSVSAIEKDFQAFQGHDLHRINYLGSACFVGYLIDQYGLAQMRVLYNTSDYEELLGASLPDLEGDWIGSLRAHQTDLTLDPAPLVAYTDEWVRAADFVFKNYNGTLLMHRAYLALDLARLALWRGQYDDVRRWLDDIYLTTGFQP